MYESVVSLSVKRGRAARTLFGGAMWGATVLAAALSGGAGAQAQQQVFEPETAPGLEQEGALVRPEVGNWPAVVLQGLDKTTARVSTVVAPLGAAARFGTLEIVARACKKKPPTEPPESAAYLEIVDVRPDSPSVALFAGWMFASSPGISALEHPVYDVWVVDCRGLAEGDGGAIPAAVQPAPGPGRDPNGEDSAELIEDPEGEAVPDGTDTTGIQ